MPDHIRSFSWALLLPIVAAALFLQSCVQPETVKPVAVEPSRPAKIGLVLGAGASRGFSHIGVIKVLEANNIPVHLVVGTSAGSFVGSLYAYGLSGFQIQKIALSLEKSDIADMSIPDNGFIKGEKLEEYVNFLLKNTVMEKLRLPFYAVATSVPSGREMIFGKGNTGSAVRASCSIPGVFRPMKIGANMYVDGGVVSPVAVDTAKKYGADFVIAVDIAADLDTRQPEGTIDTILQAVNIMYAKLSEIQLGKADIVIRPKVGHIGSAEFEKRHEAIMEGEKAANEAMPKIRALVDRLRQEGRL